MTPHELNVAVADATGLEVYNRDHTRSSTWVRRDPDEEWYEFDPAMSIKDAMGLTALPLNGCRMDWSIKGGAYNVAIYSAKGKHLRTWIISYPNLPRAIAEAFLAVMGASDGTD